MASRKEITSGVESHTPSQTLHLIVALNPTLRSTQPLLTESELEVQSPFCPVATFRLRRALPPSSILLCDYGQLHLRLVLPTAFPSSGSPNKILRVFPISPKLSAVSFALLPPATVLTNSEGKSNKGRSFVCSAWNAVCTHTPLSNFASRPSFVFSLPAGVHPTPAMSELTSWTAKRLRLKIVYVPKHLAIKV